MRLATPRSLVATLACVALGASLTGPASAAPGAATTDSASATTAAAKERPTPFALRGSAFGTEVKGGQVPAGSGRTANIWVACTNQAGKDRRNQLVGADLDGQGSVGATTTRVWTTKRKSADGAVVASHSRTNIVDIQLGPLVISGLTLRTRAWHDSDGFHADRSVRFGDAHLEGAPELPLDIPNLPGDTFEVPGLGSLTVLGGREAENRRGAWITARGLQLEIEASGSKLTIGNAYSAINDQAPAGVMRGYARGANVTALDGILTTGKLANQPMPCGGTRGHWKTNATAGIDLAGQLVIDGVSGSVRGIQKDARNVVAMARGEVANVSLGGGALVIQGLRGKANVRLVDGTIRRGIRGTRIGALIVNGEPQELPVPGETMEIPGLGEITFAKRIKPNRRRIVHVIAMQVKLLGDTPGATTINLGEAKVSLTKR